MGRVEYLNRVSSLGRGLSRGWPAPHKLLLLLYALGRVQQRLPRLVTYPELEGPLQRLLEKYGVNRNRFNAYLPFRWLITDGLWEVPEFETVPKTSAGHFHVSYLREHTIAGGLPKADYDMLRQDDHLLCEAAQMLLWHFPPSLHNEIRADVGLGEPEVSWGGLAVTDSPSRVRDPQFRIEVLEAYDHRCAVCEFDIRLGGQPLGLEAAHVKWHAYGGPDDIRNGLALCGFHHNALDRGAWRLKRDNQDYRILVSSQISGHSDALRLLHDYEGKTLRSPGDRDRLPKREFVDWHATNIFRPPPMG